MASKAAKKIEGVPGVSLVSGNGRKENIMLALGLVKEDLRGLWESRRILIKPNLTSLSKECANTSPEAVGAVVEFISANHPDFGKTEIAVAECSGGAFYSGKTTKDVFARFGYDALEKKYSNLKLLGLENCKNFREQEIECIAGKTKIRVCRETENFDYVISVAMPKTHNFAIFTGATKNMMGFVKHEDMVLMHGLRGGKESDAPKTLFDCLPPWFIPWARRNMPAWLVDFFFMAYPNYRKAVKIINRNLANVLSGLLPDLAVIDGFYGMEGNGPVNGEPVKMGVAIASADALKADGVACRLMGLEPGEIGYLCYMQGRGLGDCSTAGLVGEGIEKHARNFKMHGTYMAQRNWR